ncbi:hypothetical protein ACWT_5334 [Actinoplanes sp. SE50]|uniref:hypothetical protein n=1 Tax=unclassified Actinoplanes TaxID=2626549 RepID=UPI00023EC155|nr:MULTISPECIES: hypothetical protein [unclassified Actinoplanes]AEV86352.1 hypothetical protein ACPL_5465 [Actinoplanes sp. SE50/110]ATO84749.1 hypothetical protein ACWT_5334 [Actinoplanes sp. SE50]SLM02159.1 hypothetical protein ACSP50_5397 [Actinoplanes sp. SE50/110]
MSVSRLNRALQTPSVTPVRPSARERHQNARDDAASLTDRDRELIYQATGQRIGDGPKNAGWINSLAAAIAADRAAGRLAPGQEVTAAYLKDLSRRYDQGGTGRNPVAGYLEPALRHLSRRDDGNRLDVTA